MNDSRRWEFPSTEAAEKKVIKRARRLCKDAESCDESRDPGAILPLCKDIATKETTVVQQLLHLLIHIS